MATIEQPVPLALGTEVEVFSRFRESWVGGFEIAGIRGNAYALRRQIDWAVLPGTFAADELHPRHHAPGE